VLAAGEHPTVIIEAAPGAEPADPDVDDSPCDCGHPKATKHSYAGCNALLPDGKYCPCKETYGHVDPVMRG